MNSDPGVGLTVAGTTPGGVVASIDEIDKDGQAPVTHILTPGNCH